MSYFNRFNKLKVLRNVISQKHNIGLSFLMLNISFQFSDTLIDIKKIKYGVLIVERSK